MSRVFKRLWIIALAVCVGLSVILLTHNVTTVSHAEAAEQARAYNATASKDTADVVAESDSRSVDEYLWFTLINDGTAYSVRAIDKSVTEVRIPSEYNGLPVTEIANNGFSSCRKLTTVHIPSSVIKIGSSAFSSCNVLERVYGATKIQFIGNSAFVGCRNLKDFYIPDSVVEIGKNAFRFVDSDIYIQKQEEEFLTMPGIDQRWNLGLGDNCNIVFNTLADTVSLDETDSGFGFLLINNDTEYSVRILDKTVTEVSIPSEYNSLPVTEIASNGFSSCRKLTTVHIPSSVIKIGSSAFSSCVALEHVYGATKIQFIGNSAFVGCTQLKYFCVYDCIVSLGNNVFRNVANDIYIRMDEDSFAAIPGINSGWSLGIGSNSKIIYGTEQICEALDEADADAGYKLIHAQEVEHGVARIEDPPYYYCSEEEDGDFSPIYQIDSFAFVSWEAENLIIAYDDNLSETGFTVNLCEHAFAYMPSCTNLEIDVNFSVNDPYSDSAYSAFVFTDSAMLETITMTDSLTVVPDGAFSGCVSLSRIKFVGKEDNHLSDKITYIGDSAFSWCYSLPNIYIPSSVTTFGVSVFDGWGSETDSDGEIIQQTVYINTYLPPENASAYWNSGMGEGASIVYKTKTVTLNNQGGIGGDETVDAMYGQYLPQVAAPQSSVAHREFGGYYSAPNGAGTQYYDAEMNGKEWSKQDIDSDLTELYAHWVNKSYSIKLILDDEDGCEEFVTVTYDEQFGSIAINTTHKQGYTFGGFYSEDGTQFYNANLVPTTNKYTDTNVTELYAHWTPIRYEVGLLPNGGYGGTELVYISYQSTNVYLSETSTDIAEQITAPTRNGYNFLGFYRGDTQFFAPALVNGEVVAQCVKPWNLAQNGSLTAKWEDLIKIVYADYTGDQTPETTIDREELRLTGETYYTEELQQSKNGLNMVWSPVAITESSPKIVTVYHTDTILSLRNCYNSTTNSYEIWYPSQLLGVQNFSGQNVTVVGNFDLMQDVNLSVYSNWTPITKFGGTFKGNGHSITGIKITTPGMDAGLFGKNYGTVMDLNVSGTINVSGSSQTKVGLICGVNLGSISNCIVLAGSSIISSAPYAYIGGICGYNSNGTIVNVKNRAILSGKGNIGGIAGICDGDTTNSRILLSSNQGEISAEITEKECCIGGIVGVLLGGNVSNCTSAGQINLHCNLAGNTFYSPSAGTIAGMQSILNANIAYSFVTINGISTSGNISSFHIGGEVGKKL